MTKYDSGDEMRGRIRDTFSENIANQSELLNYFTKNPSNLRTRKEREKIPTNRQIPWKLPRLGF